MTRSLPVRPSLRFLQEQAKDLLKDQRASDARVCSTLRLLRRFHAASDGDILSADVALTEVQFALALDYGFASWPAMKQHIETVTADAASPATPEGEPGIKLVLPGVPKIGYHKRSCPFPGSAEAVLKYLGHAEPYDYLMGISGAAFRRLWHRDDGGNIDLGYFQPEPFRLMFSALGYDYRVYPMSNKPVLIEAVKQSIATGKPVIAFGIIGPPEAGLVCGYDQGGEVMIGQSFFDFAHYGDETHYYEKEDWFEDMAKKGPEFDEPGPLGMIVLGDRVQRPAPREVLATSLDWAIELARISHRANMPNHISGLAAYDSWADGLEVDEDYTRNEPHEPPDPESPTAPKDTTEIRIMVHRDQYAMLTERAEAARFLHRMAEHAGEAAPLVREAADLYEPIGAANVWPWKKHQGEEVIQGIRDGTQRRAIAAEVRRAKQMETRAVEKLEQVREALKI